MNFIYDEFANERNYGKRRGPYKEKGEGGKLDSRFRSTIHSYNFFFFFLFFLSEFKAEGGGGRIKKLWKKFGKR